MRSFILHDETLNTHGFRMLTSGANLEEFRKNPVMLLNHNDWSMPIGRWDNIRVENGKILADPVFDEQDPVGREVKRKVDGDFVRMASIGAWPPDEVNDAIELKLPGQQRPTVTRWTVREASIVTIGGNHNALAFYDRQSGQLIDISDNSNVIKLFDKMNNQSNKSMKILTGILNLADTATENDVAAAIRLVMSDRDRLKTENTTLQQRIDEVNNAAKQARTAEAISLVDEAIKDGRLEAKAKDSYLKLFDTDFDNAKTTLGAIPKRASIAAQIDSAAGQSATELADLKGKSWEDLDRAGKLVILRDKYPDLYAEKFEARFGCKPKN